MPEQVRRDGVTYIQIPCTINNCTRQDQTLLSQTDTIYRLHCSGCGTHQDYPIENLKECSLCETEHRLATCPNCEITMCMRCFSTYGDHCPGCGH